MPDSPDSRLLRATAQQHAERRNIDRLGGNEISELREVLPLWGRMWAAAGDVLASAADNLDLHTAAAGRGLAMEQGEWAQELVSFARAMQSAVINGQPMVLGPFSSNAAPYLGPVTTDNRAEYAARLMRVAGRVRQVTGLPLADQSRRTSAHDAAGEPYCTAAGDPDSPLDVRTHAAATQLAVMVVRLLELLGDGPGPSYPMEAWENYSYAGEGRDEHRLLGICASWFAGVIA